MFYHQTKNDLLTINNNSFVLISESHINDIYLEELVIILFDLYNNMKSLQIKYYKIPFKSVYNLNFKFAEGDDREDFVDSIIYNGYIGFFGSLSEEKSFIMIIFNYCNSTDYSYVDDENGIYSGYIFNPTKKELT